MHYSPQIYLNTINNSFSSALFTQPVFRFPIFHFPKRIIAFTSFGEVADGGLYSNEIFYIHNRLTVYKNVASEHYMENNLGKHQIPKYHEGICRIVV